MGDDQHDGMHDGMHDGTHDGMHDDATRGGVADHSAIGVRRPSGGVYEWLSRGRQLLAAGDAGAAAVLLRHAHAEEPGSPELVETLARAEFDSGRFGAARDLFATLVDVSPDSDYAHFGLGASLVRMGRHREAVPHLVIAAVMRPDRPEYQQLLDRARAVGGGSTDDDG